MAERNSRKVQVGRVVSDKMDKTIVVVVETYKKHPLYKKRVKYSKKFKAHDENNTAKIGDIVKIMGNASALQREALAFGGSCRRSRCDLVIPVEMIR